MSDDDDFEYVECPKCSSPQAKWSVCIKCGGDGYVELEECPELWGEDCFVEPNRLVECPECKTLGGYHWGCPTCHAAQKHAYPEDSPMRELIDDGPVAAEQEAEDE